MSSSSRFEFCAQAAMLGLLAATQIGCSGQDPSDEDDAGVMEEDDGSDLQDSASGSGGTSKDDQATDSSGGGGDASAGAGGAGDEPMGVLSSEIVPGLTLKEFTEMCDEAGGVVEEHAVCGGANSCKGFSYDDDTEALTDHTCAGYNTCSGFSCVVPD